MALLDNILGKKEVLHLGCRTCSGGDEERKRAVRILDELDIPYQLMDVSCGCEHYDLDHAAAEKAKDATIKALRGRRAMTGCARCLYLLRSYDIRTRHISQAIAKRLRHLEFNSEKHLGQVYYHDPCYLVRYAKISESPREVLRRLGYIVLDLDNNRTFTDCCGGYTSLLPLRRKATEGVLTSLPDGAIITSGCTNCTQNMKEYLAAIAEHASQGSASEGGTAQGSAVQGTGGYPDTQENTKPDDLDSDLNNSNVKSHTAKSFLELVDSALF